MLGKKGKFANLGGMAPLPPLNPCMVVYKAISELVLHQVESVRG